MSQARELSLAACVAVALAQLDAADRGAITLVYFEQRTFAQAATRLATTPKAIAEAVMRAMRVIARAVEQGVPLPEPEPTQV